MINNYKMVKVLGEGSFGHVIKCVKCDTKETVAVKVLKKSNSNHSKVREVYILEKLRCLDPDRSNIVRCHETFYRIDRSFMVFEMLDLSLYDYMCQTGNKPLPLSGIKTIIKDVATALKALKGVGLIHTDLKPDNIMMVDHQKQPFRVKLIDFGLCLEKFEVKQGQRVQPFWYRSPEVILGDIFTGAIDIWSLGITTAKMLLGFTPFPAKHDYDMLRYTIELLGEPPRTLLNHGKATALFYHKRYQYHVLMYWKFKKPEEYFKETGIKPMELRRHTFLSLDELKESPQDQENSKEAAERSRCVELLKRLLQMDPMTRITPSEILAHPFIKTSYKKPNNKSRAQAVNNTKNTTEKAACKRCSSELPEGVIMVQPAERVQRKEESKHRGATRNDSVRFCSRKDVQNKIADKNKADGGLLSESCFHTARPFISKKRTTSLRTPEVSGPKEKKTKGLRQFFSTLRNTLLSCLN